MHMHFIMQNFVDTVWLDFHTIKIAINLLIMRTVDSLGDDKHMRCCIFMILIELANFILYFSSQRISEPIDPSQGTLFLL